jgi:hypothetical protein
LNTHITTLRTKEMASMPLSTTSNNNISLNRRLTALTPRRKELMKVQMAIKPHTLITILLHRVPPIIFITLHQFARPTTPNARHPFISLALRLRVERHALKRLRAVMAAEAFGVEAGFGSRNDAASNGEGACVAQHGVGAPG